ncbi:MAG: hypothetical protein JJU26_01910 [Oceanicaulis sp.]|uniref:hypothetical protein n=1 Tax=Glycocaulis sp. TaxID=1969725 RepID=UPI0025BAD1B7|nr:hypothetical protein [Glycocaulis sp.]MCC5980452.1 hypothetical protein [Oceanicaulis sp.]MCH8521038.1 hypothetical protein [Glycocaulis sp.]
MKPSRRDLIRSGMAAGLAAFGVLGAGGAGSALQAQAEDPIPHIDIVVEKVPPGSGVAQLTTDRRGMIALRDLEAGYYEVRDLNDTVRAGIRHRGGPVRWQLRQRRDTRRPIWTLADQSDPL